jgi:hypothetical protein
MKKRCDADLVAFSILFPNARYRRSFGVVNKDCAQTALNAPVLTAICLIGGLSFGFWLDRKLHPAHFIGLGFHRKLARLAVGTEHPQGQRCVEFQFDRADFRDECGRDFLFIGILQQEVDCGYGHAIHRQA